MCAALLLAQSLLRARDARDMRAHTAAKHARRDFCRALMFVPFEICRHHFLRCLSFLCYSRCSCAAFFDADAMAAAGMLRAARRHARAIRLSARRFDARRMICFVMRGAIFAVPPRSPHAAALHDIVAFCVARPDSRFRFDAQARCACVARCDAEAKSGGGEQIFDARASADIARAMICAARSATMPACPQNDARRRLRCRAFILRDIFIARPV